MKHQSNLITKLLRIFLKGFMDHGKKLFLKIYSLKRFIPLNGLDKYNLKNSEYKKLNKNIQKKGT